MGKRNSINGGYQLRVQAAFKMAFKQGKRHSRSQMSCPEIIQKKKREITVPALRRNSLLSDAIKRGVQSPPRNPRGETLEGVWAVASPRAPQLKMCHVFIP